MEGDVDVKADGFIVNTWQDEQGLRRQIALWFIQRAHSASKCVAELRILYYANKVLLRDTHTTITCYYITSFNLGAE